MPPRGKQRASEGAASADLIARVAGALVPAKVPG